MDLRGLIYLEQGRFEEARKEFRAAAENSPARFAPKLHLGDAFLREKKFMEARDVYLDLMRETNVQVSMEKARYGLLLTYLFTQDEARAQTALERIGFPTASPAYYYAQGRVGICTWAAQATQKNGLKPQARCSTKRAQPGLPARSIAMVG